MFAYVHMTMLCLSLAFALPVTAEQRSESRMISEEEAVKAAIARAINDGHGLFAKPYVESVIFRADTGNRMVKLLPEKPGSAENSLGGMYMWVTVDAKNSRIIAVDYGGGS